MNAETVVGAVAKMVLQSNTTVSDFDSFAEDVRSFVQQMMRRMGEWGAGREKLTFPQVRSFVSQKK